MTSTYKSRAVVLQAHERIHSGAGYTATHVEEGLKKKSAYNILLYCGDQPVHLYEYECRSDGGDSVIEVRESPIVIDDGSVLEAESNNRLIQIPTSARLTHGAEVSDIGLRLVSAPSYKLSDDMPKGQEWILHPGLVYLIRAINPLGKKVEMTTRLFFYVLD